MKYAVVLRPLAENQLADIWMRASHDRDAINRASERIDALLSYDPHKLGESRPYNRRILIELPLSAVYEVVEDDKRVYVVQFRYSPKRPRS